MCIVSILSCVLTRAGSRRTISGGGAVLTRGGQGSGDMGLGPPGDPGHGAGLSPDIPPAGTACIPAPGSGTSSTASSCAGPGIATPKATPEPSPASSTVSPGCPGQRGPKLCVPTLPAHSPSHTLTAGCLPAPTHGPSLSPRSEGASHPRALGQLQLPHHRHPGPAGCGCGPFRSSGCTGEGRGLPGGLDSPWGLAAHLHIEGLTLALLPTGCPPSMCTHTPAQHADTHRGTHNHSMGERSVSRAWLEAGRRGGSNGGTVAEGACPRTQGVVSFLHLSLCGLLSDPLFSLPLSVSIQVSLTFPPISYLSVCVCLCVCPLHKSPPSLVPIPSLSCPPFPRPALPTLCIRPLLCLLSPCFPPLSPGTHGPCSPLLSLCASSPPRLPLRRKALPWWPFSAPISTGKALGGGGPGCRRSSLADPCPSWACQAWAREDTLGGGQDGRHPPSSRSPWGTSREGRQGCVSHTPRISS